MNKQIVLSALQSQLEIKKAESLNYETEVYNPSIEAKRQEILQWFKDNVSPLVSGLVAGSDSLRIYNENAKRSSWSGCDIYLQQGWRDEPRYVKMNWYSSSATTKDTDTLTDVQVFGAIAANLAKIESQMIESWSPSIIEINKSFRHYEDAVFEIERSIRAIESEIKTEKIDEYKAVGFECSISPSYYYSSEGVYENQHNIELKYGRSKHEYYRITKYKVISKVKDKYVIEIEAEYFNGNKEIIVKEKYMSDFVTQVYTWQTELSPQSKERSERRYQSLYKKTA